MPSWTKKLIAVIIGGGLVFLVGTRVREAQQEQAAPSKKKKGGDRTVSVDLASVQTGQVAEQLVLTGALKAKETVNVTPQSTGRLEKTYFQVGDRVRQGDLVAELEDSELQQRVRRAEAAIAVSAATVDQRAAELANTKANLGRAEQLFNEQLLSPQEYEQQRTGLATMQAQVALAAAQQQQAEAELEELRIQLAQTKVYAPLSGDVSVRYVDEGSLVSPSTPLIQIVNLTSLVTIGNVPERSVGRLLVGTPAEVRVDAIPDKVFRGIVARIAPVLDAATRSASIEIDILNPDRVLRAEMFVRIDLNFGTTREANLIPRDSLIYRGVESGVFLLNEQDLPVFQAVEIGVNTEDDRVEVLNLAPGTRIIGRGATMLREGDQIRISDGQPLAAGEARNGG
ncbi:MAG: efflux RND transporter periplasmic adaptor subunit [Acidobacteria bacterium]|nr:efflux RND transporter periplasmic adaptor subunit [Acidobacteriota bacterium]MDA1234778.1 efflux RND transporter periplasmic adaptor subunit [Acidobacteriota bacterium]